MGENSISISALSLKGLTAIFLITFTVQTEGEKHINDLLITVFHGVDDQYNKSNNNQWTKISKKIIEQNN